MQKTVLISGGLGAVGRATARAFAAENYRVAVLYKNTPHSEAEDFLASLPGKSHLGLQCDLSDFLATQGAVEEVSILNGRIDVCIHAASSPILRKPVAGMNPASFRQQFEVALFGGFNFFKSVAGVMKTQRSGAIIGITSSVVDAGGSLGSMPGYVAAKFALRGLLRELAKELRSYGVTVNAVSPGFMSGGLNADLPASIAEFIKGKGPSGRLTTPEEVADVILFFVSEKGRSMNGLSLSVPGGQAVDL